MTTQRSKSALRAAARLARERRTPEPHEAVLLKDAALRHPAIASARVVAAFVSMPGEPDTSDLLEALASKRVVLLPRYEPSTPSLVSWGRYRGPQGLESSGPGRPANPAGETLPAAALATADVILVPALAVDANGTRLGWGRGWYDRALVAAAPGALTLAVVHPHEALASCSELPRAAHDRPVSGWLTTRGVHLLRAATPHCDAME